jgi:hypothetical protein
MNVEAAALPRCDTGTSGLDHILGGGFPPKALYLIQGDPGVGKTTLAALKAEIERWDDFNTFDPSVRFRTWCTVVLLSSKLQTRLIGLRKSLVPGTSACLTLFRFGSVVKHGLASINHKF